MPHVRGDCVCRCHMSDVCHVVPVQVRQIVRQRFPISRQLLSSGFARLVQLQYSFKDTANIIDAVVSECGVSSAC